MIFWGSVVILFLISFIWALWSLKKEQSKPEGVKKAEKELAREKILFKSEEETGI